METALNPYQSSDLAEHELVESGPLRYRPAGAKATAAVTTLYLVAAVELIAVGARALQLFAAGRLGLAEELATGAVLLSLLALPACAITFCLWFHHAYRNVGCLGGIPTYSPGWAAGSFFVPFLNLYRPYQIAKEIWLASMPIEDDRPGHLPVALWWGCFLGGNLLASVATWWVDTESAASVRTATALLIVAGLLSIAGALFGARLVRRVEKRQAACLGVAE